MKEKTMYKVTAWLFKGLKAVSDEKPRYAVVRQLDKEVMYNSIK